MKYLIAIACAGISGLAVAQSTSRDVEIYERYENGELVEQRQSATENGKPMENVDFEELKQKMVAKSNELDVKLKEMELRFEERQTKMSLDMEKRMEQMEERMADFQNRSEKMHERMDQRLKEMESKQEQKEQLQQEKTPAPEKKPVVNENTTDLKFT